MRLVKMFKTLESELWSMENEINMWVEDTGATIVQVTGNIAPQTGSASMQGFSASDVLVVVLYEPAS